MNNAYAEDPVVDEVRQTRKEMAKKYGYGNDFKLFMKFIRELEAKSPRPHVDYSKPTPVYYPQVLQELQDAPPMVFAEERVEYGGKQEPDEGR